MLYRIRQKSTIARRLVVATLLSGLVAILASLPILLWQIGNVNLNDVAEDNLEIICQYLAAPLDLGIPIDDSPSEILVQTLLRDPGIDSLTVRDAGGRLYWSSEPDVPRSIDPNSIQDGVRAGDGLRTIVRYIHLDGDPTAEIIGSAALAIRTSPYQQLIRAAWLSPALLLIVVIPFIGTVVSILVLNRHIRRPLIHLATVASEVSSTKNYGLRAQRYSDDELGEFTSTFNNMLALIEQHEQELEDGRRKLQLEVEGRSLGERRQATVASLGQFALTHDNAAPVYDEAIREAEEILCSSHAAFLEYDRAANVLRVRVGRGPDGSETPTPGTELSAAPEWQEGYTLGGNPYVVASDYVIDKRFQGSVVFGEDSPRAGITLRIDVEGAAFGIIGFYFSELRTVNADEIHFLQSVVNVLTTVVERERATREVIAAKELAEAATRAKGQFLANMSHEIRTPMNGVIGMSDILLTTALTSTQRGYVETLQQSGEALLSVIDEILDFSKIEAGMLKLEPVAFNLERLVWEVAHLLTVSAESKGIELLVRYAPRTARNFMGDPGRLRQVITNLAGNAVKFTHEGYVLIDVDASNVMDSSEMVAIRVEDTGIGMSATAKTRAFDAFTQADDSTTKRYGGTGLGLAISKRLVELMQGEIHVVSELHQGSCFTITLPLATVQCDEELERAPEVEGRSRRVLVVDDNELGRRVLCELLDNWGFACDEASSGQEALERLDTVAKQDAHYWLAIVDQNMPVMSGSAFLTEAVARGAAPALHTIVLASVGHDPESRSDAGSCAELTLMKPITPSKLLDAIAEIEHANRPDRLALDLVVDVASNDTRDMGAADSHEPSQVRVLLAEDNEANRHVATGLLQELGCRVDIARNGAEAVATSVQYTYDLVIMDIQMPEMDGYAATRAIRERELRLGEKRRLIVAMTANAMKGDREKCLQSGMDDYVAKPVRMAALRDLFKRHYLRTTHTEAGRRARGLLLESNEEVSVSVRANLASKLPNLHLEVARSAADFYVALGSYLPEVVIIAPDTPGVDFTELVRLLRSNERLKDTQVIIWADAESVEADVSQEPPRQPMRVAGRPAPDSLVRALTRLVNAPRRRRGKTLGAENIHSEAQNSGGAPVRDGHKETLPFDFEALLSSVNGRRERVPELVKILLSEMPAAIQVVTQAVDKENFADAERAAHTLKGQAALVGATSARDSARRVEQLAATGALDELAPALAELESAVNELCNALSEHAQENSTSG